MIKAWTYSYPTDDKPYWCTSYEGDVVLVEQEGVPLQFRVIKDGSISRCAALPSHRITPLHRKYWPPWLVDLDEYSVDVGL